MVTLYFKGIVHFEIIFDMF